jgi:hypothetical protein
MVLALGENALEVNHSVNIGVSVSLTARNRAQDAHTSCAPTPLN